MAYPGAYSGSQIDAAIAEVQSAPWYTKSAADERFQRKHTDDLRNYEAQKVGDDWAPAIQAGLDALAVAGGGILIVPASDLVYELGSDVVVPTKCGILGKGPALTRFFLQANANLTSRTLAYPIRGADITTDPETDTSPNMHAVFITDPAGNEDASMEGFALDMNGDAQTDIQAPTPMAFFGVHVYNAQHAKVKDVYVHNSGSWGNTADNKAANIVDHRATDTVFERIRSEDAPYEALLFANGSKRARARHVWVSVANERYGIAQERAEDSYVEDYYILFTGTSGVAPVHQAASVGFTLKNGVVDSVAGVWRGANQMPAPAEFRIPAANTCFSNTHAIIRAASDSGAIFSTVTTDGFLVIDGGTMECEPGALSDAGRMFNSTSESDILVCGGFRYVADNPPVGTNVPAPSKVTFRDADIYVRTNTSTFPERHNSGFGTRGNVRAVNCIIHTESATKNCCQVHTDSNAVLRDCKLSGGVASIGTSEDGEVEALNCVYTGAATLIDHQSTGRARIRGGDGSGLTSATPLSGIGAAEVSDVEGVISRRVVVSDADHNVDPGTLLVVYDVLTDQRFITLGNADTYPRFVPMTFKSETADTGTHNLTLQADPSEGIDGASSIDITVPYGAVTVYTTGDAFFTI